MSGLTAGGVLSAQITLMLPPASSAICGLLDWPRLLDRFLGIEKVAPLSDERLKKMSGLPGPSFSHATLMLPVRSTVTCGLTEFPMLLERLFGIEKVAP